MCAHASPCATAACRSARASICGCVPTYLLPLPRAGEDPWIQDIVDAAGKVSEGKMRMVVEVSGVDEEGGDATASTARRSAHPLPAPTAPHPPLTPPSAPARWASATRATSTCRATRPRAFALSSRTRRACSACPRLPPRSSSCARWGPSLRAVRSVLHACSTLPRKLRRSNRQQPKRRPRRLPHPRGGARRKSDV